MNALSAQRPDALCGSPSTDIVAMRRMIFAVAGCLFLLLAVLAWNHFQDDKWFNSWTSVLGAGLLAAGLGYSLFALIGLEKWRQDCVGELARSAQKSSSLQARFSEVSSREAALAHERAALQQRVAELEKAILSLQEKSKKRRLDEMVSRQRQQELVRSKNVLEMHVQERTEKIQRLQRRYSMILNSAGEGICGLDADGRATFVNPAAARITGWDVNELVGRHIIEVLDLKTNGAAPGCDGDQVLRRKDGSRLAAECIYTTIVEQGMPNGAVLIFRDVTERKRAEATLAHKAAELARSNAELEQFAFVASHDLQEPLRKIQAFGDRLKAKCESVNLGEGRDYLERMQGASARMQRLINDLLSFSRVYQRTEPFSVVELDCVLREVLSDLEVRVEATNAQIDIAPLPAIEADPTQMRQLFQNLISNALKFQPPNQKPVVKITCRGFEADGSLAPEIPAGTPFCEILIEDNGIGFEEAYAEKIFAVFQRLHGRAEFEGTGVGLAVCRRITDRHCGTIKASSQPGRGARFKVVLPVKQFKRNQMT